MKLQFLSAIFLSLVLVSCHGQNRSVSTNLTDRLVDRYNKKQFDSIFYSFSPDMQAVLPLEKTPGLFLDLHQQFGLINKISFIDKKDGFDRYRADFEKGILWMGFAEDLNGKISGLYFKPFDGPGSEISSKRNSTKLSLPFKGEWFVFWGGDTKEQNYHVISQAQKNAFDLVMVDSKGSSFKTNGKKNEDYYAYGQPMLAACDARVVSVTEGVKENIPGETNPQQVTGNSVVLKTAAGEFILYAHLIPNSIKVKSGDEVKKGEVLGQCGNSGNATEPHLHFHIQDKEKMIGSTGIKCFFEKIAVNGTPKTDYSPVRGDRIQNIN